MELHVTPEYQAHIDCVNDIFVYCNKRARDFGSHAQYINAVLHVGRRELASIKAVGDLENDPIKGPTFLGFRLITCDLDTHVRLA